MSVPSAQNLPLHVDDSGSGEAVLFLHSSGLSGRQWRRLAGDATRAGMRAIVPDLSGHGRSPAWSDDSPFAYTVDVDAMTSLLETAGRAHIVGHSYGGFVAAHVARRAPERVLSLSLYDPVCFGVLDPDEDADVRAILQAIDFRWGPTPTERDHWLRAFVDFWNGKGGFDALSKDVADEFRRVAWVVEEGVRTLLDDRTTLDAFRSLPFPAHLLTGEKSPMPAQRVVERLAAAIPNGRRTTIAGAGHLGPVTHGAAVNEAILSGFGSRVAS